MWIVPLLLCIALLILLGYNSYLRQQVADHEREENRLWTISESNIKSKQLLVRWVGLKTRKKEILTYLHEHGIKRIAIYGLAEVGELLWEELEHTDIEIVCGIDKSKIPYGRKAVRPEDFQEDVDAIIVTAFYYFSEIYDQLNQTLKGKTPIIGLDEIILELCQEAD